MSGRGCASVFPPFRIILLHLMNARVGVWCSFGLACLGLTRCYMKFNSEIISVD